MLSGSRKGKDFPKSVKSADSAKPKILPCPIIFEFSGKMTWKSPSYFLLMEPSRKKGCSQLPLIKGARWVGTIYLFSGRHERGHLAVLGKELKPPGSYTVDGLHRKWLWMFMVSCQCVLRYGPAEGLHWGTHIWMHVLGCVPANV